MAGSPAGEGGYSLATDGVRVAGYASPAVVVAQTEHRYDRRNDQALSSVPAASGRYSALGEPRYGNHEGGGRHPRSEGPDSYNRLVPVPPAAAPAGGEYLEVKGN